jgi:hypothetical protein
MTTSDQRPLDAAAPSWTTPSTASIAQGWLAHFGVTSATELDLGTLMAIQELVSDGLAPRDGESRLMA